MTAADLAKFEPQRRYTTLVALVAEAIATIIDEIVNLHDQIIGRLFNRAKHQHQQFQESGKAINDKVRLYGKVGRALLEARENGVDAFAAIESVIPWPLLDASTGIGGWRTRLVRSLPRMSLRSHEVPPAAIALACAGG